MDLGLEEIRQLVDLVHHSDLSELVLEAGDVKIALKKGLSLPAGAEPLLAIAPAAVQAGVPLNLAPMSAPLSPAQASVPLYQAPLQAPGTAGQGAEPAKDEPGFHRVKSPMVGTFYRAASPDSPPFVEVGSVVEPGQTVCIIEAMKLMNEIEAEHGGRVARILVNNGEPVDFGQVLVEIES